MMIQPEDIRRKAENLYPDCVRAWLDGDEAFFPRVIPARKTPDDGDLAGAMQSVRRLREGSKEMVGFGYTVQWREVNSRKFGRNQFPVRILFEARADLLRFIGKQREFAVCTDAVIRLRAEFPVLDGWIRSNVRALVDAAPDLNGLVRVLHYFYEHPRPNRFARELPLPVETKFIERYKAVLRDWFDIVLPPHTIRADEEHFERRYGLRYAEPHLLVRLLEPALEQELGFPCSEFSLPLHTLGAMSMRADVAVVVENKVNLLTLPQFSRGIGLGGLGSNVVLLRYLAWLNDMQIVYWGDLDTEGFGILSALRALFPHTRSFLMDLDTLNCWRHLAVPGTGRSPNVPGHLTDSEQRAYLCCRDHNLRLEQERIPQDQVLNAVKCLLQSGAQPRGNTSAHSSQQATR
jgi:hypothetical protein